MNRLKVIAHKLGLCRRRDLRKTVCFQYRPRSRVVTLVRENKEHLDDERFASRVSSREASSCPAKDSSSRRAKRQEKNIRTHGISVLALFFFPLLAIRLIFPLVQLLVCVYLAFM